MENSDCCIIINKERKRGTNLEYLTFMLVKQRYRNDSGITYFNHPFVEGNTMRLVDDIWLPDSVSETSLQSEFVDASDEFKRTNAKEREDLGKAPTLGLDDMDSIWGRSA